MKETKLDKNLDVPLEIIKAIEIKPKEIEWLWYPYIPFGKLTILQGDPGDGKSKFILSLIAKLTSGDILPFTSKSLEPIKVIYQTTEDDKEDTIVPRFISSGGNGNNLIFIREDNKHLSFGDSRIREAIEKYNAKLLVLDPLSAYLREGTSMNNANEMRSEFNNLINVARDTNCAIVIIAHMNKANDVSPLYRTSGSIDIAAAARSILAIARDPQTENIDERYLVQIKNNLARKGKTIIFEVCDDGVEFIKETEMTAEEVFSFYSPRIGRPNEIELKVQSSIKDLLKDGDVLATDCEAYLESKGFKKSTIKKAKRNLGVVSRKSGFVWYWSLSATNESSEK